MNPTQITYLTFGLLLILALVFDLGLMSKRHTHISIRKALFQTLFWVGLSFAFFVFLWFEKTPHLATKYITAYLMEWSLSIDNIFVFILIFSFFKVPDEDSGRVLLVGILLAIFFRILFIAAGIGLIERFHWLLYIFGAFLIFTGYRLFFQKDDDEFDPSQSRIYKFMMQYLRITEVDPKGRYVIKVHGKTYFTHLAMVVVMLAAIDLVFALDSIPTVVSLVREHARKPFTSDDILVIYSSNIFAVLGLRSLFFLLKGAVHKFEYLQQGIAVVLAFIGVKMLIEYFHIEISIYISLLFIVICLSVSIAYSLYVDKKRNMGKGEDDSI
jgi:tellurite resistance protein TerC